MVEWPRILRLRHSRQVVFDQPAVLHQDKPVRHGLRAMNGLFAQGQNQIEIADLKVFVVVQTSHFDDAFASRNDQR
jgi:hypothetical protein